MEKDGVAQLLSKIDVGFLPYEIFEQFARLMALPILEIVPLRFNDSKVEILMLERAKDDKFWPGMLHTPGSVIRAYDRGSDFKDAVDRIINDELGGPQTGTPVFVKSILNDSKRGKEVALVYWVEITGGPKIGTFYDAANLPDGRVESQEFIQDAVEHFKKHRGLKR